MKQTRSRVPNSTAKSIEEEAKEFFEKNRKEVPELNSQVTLRDYFAGAALSGLLSVARYGRAEDIVEEAYRYADLMIERSKETKE